MLYSASTLASTKLQRRVGQLGIAASPPVPVGSAAAAPRPVARLLTPSMHVNSRRSRGGHTPRFTVRSPSGRYAAAARPSGTSGTTVRRSFVVSGGRLSAMPRVRR